ncbi:MAG TPA: PilZ domain-containing protein [Pyrinomonadaceae bacterium]|jgi:hypothetical protein|nr:PilZ domain-containing protein [Pyrinomonadaceae bacterium]
MERRRAGRVETNLNARWEGILASRTGNIVDLSWNGCFVLTADEVILGELIRIEIEFPEKGRIYLWGEVVYKNPEIGFGLRFTGSGEAEESVLRDYVQAKRAHQAA